MSAHDEPQRFFFLNFNPRQHTSLLVVICDKLLQSRSDCKLSHAKGQKAKEFGPMFRMQAIPVTAKDNNVSPLSTFFLIPQKVLKYVQSLTPSPCFNQLTPLFSLSSPTHFVWLAMHARSSPLLPQSPPPPPTFQRLILQL